MTIYSKNKLELFTIEGKSEILELEVNWPDAALVNKRKIPAQYNTVHQLMCCVWRDCLHCFVAVKRYEKKKKCFKEDECLKQISQCFFFFFVLLLSSKNYSVYYSTKKYIMLNTAPPCHWTFNPLLSVQNKKPSCERQMQEISICLTASSPFESVVSEQLTMQKIFSDNRGRQHRLLEKKQPKKKTTAAMQSKTDDTRTTGSIVKISKPTLN